MKLLLRLALLMLCLTTLFTAPARAGEDENKRAKDAVRVLKEVMMAPDKGIPSNLLKRAFREVAVIGGLWLAVVLIRRLFEVARPRR